MAYLIVAILAVRHIGNYLSLRAEIDTEDRLNRMSQDAIIGPVHWDLIFLPLGLFVVIFDANKNHFGYFLLSFAILMILFRLAFRFVYVPIVAAVVPHLANEN